MKYVLDSSVGFKWLVVEAHTMEARRLREEYRKAKHDLHSPDIYPVEIAHALTRAERQGRITPVEGKICMIDMLKILPRLHSYIPLLPRAYEISSQVRIGVYDCIYVALAEQEGCELITADYKLVKNLQPLFPFITPLTSLP